MRGKKESGYLTVRRLSRLNYNIKYYNYNIKYYKLTFNKFSTKREYLFIS